jgi:hypothetical protein
MNWKGIIVTLISDAVTKDTLEDKHYIFIYHLLRLLIKIKRL